MRRLTVVALAVLMTACVSETRKEAEARLGQAKELMQSGKMEQGVALLDSIALWYPEEFKIVGEALTLKRDAGQAFHEQFIDQAQSMLDDLEPRIKELSRNFVLIPGPPGRPGIYEHKRQTVRNSWNRIFLKVNVTEDGQFWLTSHYYGTKWIDHTSIKVYDRDIYEFSDTLGPGHPDNHKTEDGADRWEKIDFRDGSDSGVVPFIIQNQSRNIKVRLTGREHYYILMEKYDKEAVKEGYELAQVLKDAYEIRQKIDRRKKELRLLGVSADSIR